MEDELNAPLGLQPREPQRRRLARGGALALAGALATALLAFAGWALFTEDPLGGEPSAVASLQGRRTDPAATAAPAAPGAGPAAATAAKAPPDEAGKPAAAAKPETKPEQNPETKPEQKPEQKTVTIIDGMSGRRQQVTIAAGAERKPAGGEARLLESSRHGSIPKIAADGARPLDVYASPQAKALRGSGPRVAIVVGRLGISGNLTTEALARLPAAVTLAFPPYVNDLDRWIARARGEGREVLLQVPMEPFDYPDNDPGPQALLIGAAPEQNADRLHWAMSRAQGYVGLTNYMGARFVTHEAAITTVMREARQRGLAYFDDGTSARSLAAQLAAANGVPFAKADVVLDAAATAADMDNALARLETIARERGLAVGSASIMPMAIERIARWAKAAAGRGVTLVPLTAAASKPKPS